MHIQTTPTTSYRMTVFTVRIQRIKMHLGQLYKKVLAVKQEDTDRHHFTDNQQTEEHLYCHVVVGGQLRSYIHANMLLKQNQTTTEATQKLPTWQTLTMCRSDHLVGLWFLHPVINSKFRGERKKRCLCADICAA